MNITIKILLPSLIILSFFPHNSQGMYIRYGKASTSALAAKKQQQRYLNNKEIVAKKTLDPKQLNTINRQTINLLAQAYKTTPSTEDLASSRAKILIDAINAEKTLQINDGVTEKLEDALVQRVITFVPNIDYKIIKQYHANLKIANAALEKSNTQFNVLEQERQQELYDNAIKNTAYQAKVDPNIITSLATLDIKIMKNITQKLITETSANNKLLNLYKYEQIGTKKEYVSAINEYFDINNQHYAPHGRFLGILLIYAILKNIELEKIALNKEETGIYNDYLPETIKAIFKKTGKIVLFSESETATKKQNETPPSDMTTNNQEDEQPTTSINFFSSIRNTAASWYDYFMGKK